MAESRMMEQSLRSNTLNIVDMGTELKCPCCLKPMEMPNLLPCKHILCSRCTDISTENGCECPFCKISFANQDNTIPVSPGNEHETQRSKKQMRSPEGEELQGKEDSDCDKNDNPNEDSGEEIRSENLGKSKRRKSNRKSNIGTNRTMECVFCLSLEPTEGSGKLLHLLNGREVDLGQATKSNVFHGHEKCIGGDSSAPSGDLVYQEASKNGPSESSGWGKDWILCDSDLDKEKKSTILDKLAHISGTVATSSWDEKVTHVIVDVDRNGACTRTAKVLKAILTGQWVLSIEWAKACIEASHPVPEDSYEITCDDFGSLEGPRLGRFMATQKVPRLLTGWNFYLSDDNFKEQSYKKFYEDLILVGGGKLLNIDDLVRIEQAAMTPQKIVFVYNTYQPIKRDCKDHQRILKLKQDIAEANADAIGGLTLGHHLLFDSIAAYRFPMN